MRAAWVGGVVLGHGLTTKINIDLLFLEVQKYLCLYNPEDASHRDSERAQNVWREIGKVLHALIRAVTWYTYMYYVCMIRIIVQKVCTMDLLLFT